MKQIINWIKKELVIKLDFVNNEYEIGLVWIIFNIIQIILYIIKHTSN
jgi:hypothetical protein